MSRLLFFVSIIAVVAIGFGFAYDDIMAVKEALELSVNRF